MNRRSAMSVAAGVVLALVVAGVAVASGVTGPDAGAAGAQGTPTASSSLRPEPETRTGAVDPTTFTAVPVASSSSATESATNTPSATDTPSPTDISSTATPTSSPSLEFGDDDDDAFDDHGGDDGFDDHGDEDNSGSGSDNSGHGSDDSGHGGDDD